MKWKSGRNSEKVRPFLVLPLLDNERSVSAESQLKKTKMPTGLRLITRNISAGTGTWPPKIKQKKCKHSELNPQRPMTATLERPEVLNINLIDKIDMSLVRKEFLCITNLCKIPLETLSKHKKSNINKRRSLRVPLKCFTPSNKRSRNPEASESSVEDEESQRSVKNDKKTAKVNKPVATATKSARNDTNNNDEDTKTAKHRGKGARSVDNVKSIDDAFVGPRSVRSLPEPCTTCGRPDQPERFHSHPANPVAKKKTDSPRKIVKSTVQKPVAIKYKSPVKLEDAAKKSPVMLNVKAGAQDKTEAARSKSPVRGPRTVICYICGREFGTASLHLHEPKCLQKWERENSLLPRHMQRKLPVKPDKPLSNEEWNQQAWQSSQAALSPCEHCGRTFLPDRLLVHQRSCKPGSHKVNIVMRTPICSSSASPKSERNSPVSPGPPSVPCYICGRLFGTKSIGIHEPQCLKKWHVQNNNRSPSQKLPIPVKNVLPVSEPVSPPTPVQEVAAARPLSAGPKKPMLPCYICGREYGTSSIYIHEPQCLKKWRAENEKLPPSQRRKEPAKPDIVFTPSGQIDYQATNEKIWQCHLSQLVACQNCGRTFNPDRVSVHQKSCKGP